MSGAPSGPAGPKAPPTGQPPPPGGDPQVPAPAPTTLPSSPNASLFFLFVSLLGFVGFALMLYEFKFHHVTEYFHGFPTRVLFVVVLGAAAAPFFLTVARRVPVVFLILPVVLIVFIYPLFSPFGLPFTRDPVFNFQFAEAVLNHPSWAPGQGVTAQAVVYSYYPGGAIFNAEAASLTSLSLFQTFNWAYELFRFLVIPLAIYALAGRVFGYRSAALAVLLYLSVPSIEMNVPTQQDFGVTFFLLAVVGLGFLATSGGRETGFLRAMIVVASTLVIMSHHVSTYLLVGWVAGFALLPWLLWRRDPYPAARAPWTLLRTVVTALLWVAVVTLPVIQEQVVILAQNIAAILSPPPGGASSTLPGSTFPLYDVAWIMLAILLVGFFAILTLVETYRDERRAFVTFGLLTALLIAVLSVPFISTGFSFLSLRQLEYSGVILAPAAAWFLVERLAPALWSRRRRQATVASAGDRRRRPSRPGGAPVVLAFLLAFVIFTGGSLVPLSSRDQFANQSKGVLVDSPMFVNQNAFAVAQWAAQYLNPGHAFWGDYLAYTVLGGFGHLRDRYDPYPLFETATFVNISGVLGRLLPGDYVVTDVYMTTAHLSPMFPGPGSDQPNGPIPVANIAKFANCPDFALLYQDSIFSIYVTLAVPAPGSC